MRKHKYLSMVVVVAISFSGTGYSLANQEPKRAYDDSEQVIGGSVQDLEKKMKGGFSIMKSKSRNQSQSLQLNQNQIHQNLSQSNQN
ncbi:hypothetical protein AB6G19_25160 [Providencia manganoxydans]